MEYIEYMTHQKERRPTAAEDWWLKAENFLCEHNVPQESPTLVLESYCLVGFQYIPNPIHS